MTRHFVSEATRLFFVGLGSLVTSIALVMFATTRLDIV